MKVGVGAVVLGEMGEVMSVTGVVLGVVDEMNVGVGAVGVTAAVMLGEMEVEDEMVMVETPPHL